jgi:glycosyltransferase involved in cell wall biosynthesis
MHISVIICTYNRSKLLKNSLGSLQKLNIPEDLSFELIVVDNNSTDDTQEVVKSFLPESKMKKRYVFEACQGLSNARNRGIKETESDILVFTDDDMEFDPNWLLEISSVFKKYDCICVAGKIIPKWPQGKPPWLIDDGPYQIPSFDGRFDLGNLEHEIKKPLFGGNMAFKRTAFKEYGFFRTDLGRSGNTFLSNEETEFCNRLFAAGEKIVYSPNAKVYHLLNNSHGTKSYYLKRMFSYGKSNIRMKYESNKVADDISILYLMKKFYRISELFVKWLFTLDTGIRFNRRLMLYRLIGEFTESIAIHRRKNFL